MENIFYATAFPYSIPIIVFSIAMPWENAQWELREGNQKNGWNGPSWEPIDDDSNKESFEIDMKQVEVKELCALNGWNFGRQKDT